MFRRKSSNEKKGKLNVNVKVKQEKVIFEDVRIHFRF